MDVQSEERDEVLQGVSAAWRQADSVLHVQQRRLSRAGAGAARRSPAGAGTRCTIGPDLHDRADHVTLRSAAVTSLSIKACCADLDASDLARQVLGDSFHPGGIELTQRLGVLVGVGSESRVLDLASGRGASALHLAGRFGCQVVGVDYSTANVS